MGTARRFIILAMLALIISTPARAQDDDDPLMQAAKQAGKGIGEYLGYKMSLEATILARRAELARCGSCPQREALERALAEAELQKGFSNAVEGAWLRSIGLEYDSFGEMLRAMWEDAGRRAERAREEDAERRLMFRLRQPVTLWCTLKRGSRDAGECTNEFFAKWARDLGEHTTSPTFGRRLQEQQWRIQAACFNSLLKLRVEAAGPRPADPPVPGRRRADNPRRTAATPVPPEAETRACEGQMWEWARLRNEVDAFCVANGGTRPHLTGRLAERYPRLANQVDVDYAKCSSVVQRRSVDAPAREVDAGAPAREKPAAVPEPVPASRRPARSAMAATTAIPPGTVLVMRLLTGVDATTRSGALIRAALRQPLVVDGAEVAQPGATFTFRYRIAADRRDRRQLAYTLEPQTLEIGAGRVRVTSVVADRGTPALEGQGEGSLVLPAGTVLTVIVR